MASMAIPHGISVSPRMAARLPRGARLAVARVAVASLAGALLLSACHKEKPAPSIDGLSAALERSAEKELAAPTLANEQIVLTAKSGQADSQADGVLHAATQAGGVGLRSTGTDGVISILATIPENNSDAFKSTVRNAAGQEKAPMSSPSSTTRLIEVLIEPPAPTPSPAP